MVVKPKNPEQLISLLKEKPLILYGAGGAGMKIAQWCDLHDIQYCFTDRDFSDKQKETGKTVISPDELKRRFPEANIVVTSIVYSNEIFENLKLLGFKKEQILSYKIFMPQDSLTWSDLDNDANWDSMQHRISMISGWIDPEVHSVADYGAGKMYLKSHLKAGVKYYPIDYIQRTEETILCDFNKGSFPDLKTDVSICCGVLEFIHTAEQLLCNVCKNTARQVIISYVTLDKFPNIEGRRASAYVSDLTEQGIADVMRRSGYYLDKKVPDPIKPSYNTLYVYERFQGEMAIHEVR